MPKVISLIREYFRTQFHKGYFLSIFVFTAILVFIEYNWNIEETYIDLEPKSHLRLIRYISMYLLAFGGAYFLLILDPRHRNLLKKPALWGMILLSVVLFSVRTWYHHYEEIYKQLLSPSYWVYARKCITNLQGLLFLFFPLLVYWYWADRKQQAIYGFYHKGVSLKPYFLMLLIMLPAIVAASTQSDFLETYPRLFHLHLPKNGDYNLGLKLFYEICYAIDFVTTEFFFRGFLILAIARVAGPQVILPMCVFYVVIHFGKPLGETISSFFGGWLLGILAYQTKSIYGGVIVHLGIALMMEVVAYVAHVLK